MDIFIKNTFFVQGSPAGNAAAGGEEDHVQPQRQHRVCIRQEIFIGRQNMLIKINYAHIPKIFKSHKLYLESDTSSSSAAGPNIGAGRSGDAGRLGAAGGHGVGGGLGVGGRGVGQMAPMLKPRLGDMYQEESEAEGQFNPIFTVTLIFNS